MEFPAAVVHQGVMTHRASYNLPTNLGVDKNIFHLLGERLPGIRSAGWNVPLARTRDSVTSRESAERDGEICPIPIAIPQAMFLAVHCQDGTPIKVDGSFANSDPNVHLISPLIAI